MSVQRVMSMMLRIAFSARAFIALRVAMKW
uniref:Uncharacterized protein n=1 Tax=Leviviridae sp. TaxID=2027243 RepID=A0A514DBD9_9VIRU|nr:MAG: hypothetical protein H2BulkLitter112773_000002 [Leviviridae sp.]